MPGAAASALTTLRRGWKTEPAVGFTKQQDVVHRVVGPPGIVLVGEGNPTRVKALLATERRRHERVAAEVPIHEIVVGNDEGQVPLPKLVKHVSKLKRQVAPADMTDLLSRLKAIDAARPAAPAAEGPRADQHEGLARPDARPLTYRVCSPTPLVEEGALAPVTRPIVTSAVRRFRDGR